jgi:drug/metabolite transporter (DMT)-like permease
VQYSLAFALYLTALKAIPAAQAAIYLTLIPVFGVSGGVLFLGESLTPIQAAGAVLIVLALMGLNALRRR